MKCFPHLYVSLSCFSLLVYPLTYSFIPWMEDVACGRKYSDELLVYLHGNLTQLWHVVDRDIASFCLVYLMCILMKHWEEVKQPAFMFTLESKTSFLTESNIS